MLTLPVLCPKSMAQNFLRQHQDWIDAHQYAPEDLVFTDGMIISVLGQSVQICHKPSQKGTGIENDKLYVAGDKAFLNRRVTDFIKRQTGAYIDKRARELASQIGQKIHRITLKDTTSRWGSCSAAGNLNFCWRLGLAPLFVLDYIIAHEVAHLQEMNHSLHFWRVVAMLCDRRSEAEIWLRRNGQSLRYPEKSSIK